MQREPWVTRHTENLTRIASRAWVSCFTRKWYYGRIGRKKRECGSEYQSKRKSIYRILNICFIICMRWDKSPVCRSGTEGPSWGASMRRDSWMNKSKLWHCWLIHAELSCWAMTHARSFHMPPRNPWKIYLCIFRTYPGITLTAKSVVL